MSTQAHIVVGYDGQPDSIASLPWAARAASLRGEGLVVTTIVDPRDTPRGVPWPESYWDEIADRAGEVLAGHPEVRFTMERHYGHVVPRLVESARGSSMLVLGSKGHGLIGEIMRGSVSRSAARHASVPVVVVRPAQSPDSGRIVVGADGSMASARALEFACEMALATGEKVVALRAFDTEPVVPDRRGHRPPDQGSIEQAQEALGQVVDVVRAAHPDVAVEGEFIHQAPDRALVDASHTASLVVVGPHGRGTLAEMLIGSVSRTLLHHAHSPVAVVH